MNCLNTKGCYNKKARKGSNFCSDDCRLIYENRIEPPKGKRKIYYDPERQKLHDIYFKHYCEQPTSAKRGVKRGEKRGPYKKTRARMKTFVCKGCGRTFKLKSKRKKQFHSETCRRKYWRDKKNLKDAEERMKRKY